MRLADVSIKRPVLATVMVGVLLVFGLAAYPRIGVDLFPSVEFPIVTITAVYPGADPEAVESKVVDKIEEAVNTVNGIDVLRSTSMESVGIVVVQFKLERNADQAVQDVRDKVSAILRDLPPGIDPPVVQKFDIGAAPILALALSGPQDPRELTRVAKDVVKDKIQTIPGVGGVTIVGGREREFDVWVKPEALESRGVAADDLLRALAAQNVEIPGGRIDVGRTELAVKTHGQVKDAAELGNIIISGTDGFVRVRDVARVEDGSEEERSYSQLDGKSAVALVIQKQSGTNTVQVAHAVHEALDGIEKSGHLGAGMTISIPNDNAVFIEHSIDDVKFDLFFGALLAVVIILFFLHDWRATLISALAIPTSVIATFAFIGVMGFTLNNMTMLALSLSIGILVDDAIVVIENIHRHLEMGKPAMKAASEATAEIGLAVMATTASVVAVFVPVATMRGIVGRFFYQFGLTVAFAVSVSLFVAFTLTPMLSSRLLRVKHEEKWRLARWIESFLKAIDVRYRAILGWALRNRWKTVGLATVAFVASIGIGALVPFEFLPPNDMGMFNLSVELPPGTSLEATRDFTDRVVEVVKTMPGVADTFVTVGGGAENEVNKSQVQVNLVPRKKRAFSQKQAMEYARHLFAGRKDAVFAVEEVNLVGGGGGGFRQALVQFNIRGHDYDELNKSAAQIMDVMKKSGGYVDLDTTYRGGKPEIRVDIDRDRAAAFGVPVASIAMTIRNLVAGEKATEISTGGDRYDVRVRLEASARTRPEDLLALRVRSMTGALVPLSAVARISKGEGPAQIERQDRQRQVTVFANLEGKALGEAVSEVEKTAKQVVPPDLTTDWAGMGQVMQDSIAAMGAALILAIVIVYLILAAQFESFLHPFTIMLSLPLSLIGALGALAISRMTMNIFSMIGVIMLMGLVTKNAILLVDYTNQLRRQGKSRDEALLAAGPVRLRPILMTTAAMIFGMIPVALALSEGGEQRAPMAVVVIGGLITSTMLTLVVIPVAYSLLDGIVAWIRARLPSRGPAPETADLD